MNHQDFWNDNELAQKVLQENKGLKETVEEYNQLKESLEEIEVLIEIGLEESDDSIDECSFLNCEKCNETDCYECLSGYSLNEKEDKTSKISSCRF